MSGLAEHQMGESNDKAELLCCSFEGRTEQFSVGSGLNLRGKRDEGSYPLFLSIRLGLDEG